VQPLTVVPWLQWHMWEQDDTKRNPILEPAAANNNVSTGARAAKCEHGELVAGDGNEATLLHVASCLICHGLPWSYK
jgi:hypothetical protein